jgi:hypothetical protein
MRRKLTATSVRQLKAPKTGQLQYNDSELPGFALRITANGVRSFVLQYRPRSGSHKGRWTRWTIGRLASSPEAASGTDLLTLGQAREIARHARIAIRDQGADPARDGRRLEADDAPETYAEAVEKYIETYQIKKRENRTAGEVRRLLLKEGADWLDRPVNEITRSQTLSISSTLAPRSSSSTLAFTLGRAKRRQALSCTFFDFAL